VRAHQGSERGSSALPAALQTSAVKTAVSSTSSIAAALWARGEVFAETDSEKALDAYERAVAIARQSGNRFWETLVIPKVAALQARSGDPIGALRSFLDTVNSWHQSTDLMFVSHGLGGLIVLFDRLGHATAAATLNGALTAMVESTAFLHELPDATVRVRRVLGDAAFDDAARRGAAMAFSEVVNYASDQVLRSLATLGADTIEHI